MERQIGIWSLSSGLKIHEPNMFERRSNFGGISLTNIFLPYPPFLIENSSDVLDGVSVEIVKMLQMALNFSTVYMKPSDGLWGGRNDNGKEYVNIFSTRKKEKVFQCPLVDFLMVVYNSIDSYTPCKNASLLGGGCNLQIVVLTNTSHS